jgi:hypothetical protein
MNTISCKNVLQANSYGYYDNGIEFLRVTLDLLKNETFVSGSIRKEVDTLKRNLIKINNLHVTKKKQSIGPHFKVKICFISTALYSINKR